jgi:predicted nucleic acid-binding protein
VTVSSLAVDASALAAVAFGESRAVEVDARIARKTLLAPALLPFELVNVAWKKSRRQPATAEEISKQLGSILRVPVTVVAVDHEEALQLALLWGLSGYDASYLWVAWRRSVELVTLDRRLAAVAAEMGLS